MSEFIKQLLIVCPLLFLAGMCDAIAGGGGTISLPVHNKKEDPNGIPFCQ